MGAIVAIGGVALALLAQGQYKTAIVASSLPLVAYIVLAIRVEFLLACLVLGFSFTWPLIEVRPLGQLTFIRLDDLLYALLFMRWLLDLYRGQWKGAVFVREMGWMPVLFLVSPMISFLFLWPRVSLEPAAKSLYYVLKHLQYVSIFPIAYVYLYRSKFGSRLIDLLLLGAMLVAAYGILEYVNLVPTGDNVGLNAKLEKLHTVGVTSTLSVQHAHIAVYITLILSLIFGRLASARNSGERIIYMVMMVAMLVVGALSLARLAVIGTATTIIVFLTLRRAKGFAVAAVTAVVVAVMYPWLASLGESSAPGGMGRLFVWEGSQSFELRTLIWRSTIEASTANVGAMLFGSGFGMFPYSLASALFERTHGVPASGAHNSYLMTFSELGATGLGVLMAFQFGIIKKVWDSVRAERDPRRRALMEGYLAGLVGTLAMAGGIDVWFPATGLESLMGYYFMMMAVVLGQVRSSEGDGGCPKRCDLEK